MPKYFSLASNAFRSCADSSVFQLTDHKAERAKRLGNHYFEIPVTAVRSCWLIVINMRWALTCDNHCGCMCSVSSTTDLQMSLRSHCYYGLNVALNFFCEC